QISPTAFQHVAQTLIRDNQDFVSQQLFGMKVTPEDVNAFKQFKESGAKASANDDEIVVPEFDPASGKPLSEEIQNMIMDNIRRAREAEASRQATEQRISSDKAAADAVAREAEIEKENARIDTAINTYRQERMKVIDNTIASLRLQVLPTDT